METHVKEKTLSQVIDSWSGKLFFEKDFAKYHKKLNFMEQLDARNFSSNISFIF